MLWILWSSKSAKIGYQDQQYSTQKFRQRFLVTFFKMVQMRTSAFIFSFTKFIFWLETKISIYKIYRRGGVQQQGVLNCSVGQTLNGNCNWKSSIFWVKPQNILINFVKRKCTVENVHGGSLEICRQSLKISNRTICGPPPPSPIIFVFGDLICITWIGYYWSCGCSARLPSLS